MPTIDRSIIDKHPEQGHIQIPPLDAVGPAPLRAGRTVHSPQGRHVVQGWRRKKKTQADATTTLKQQLLGLLQPLVLSSAERGQVIGKATSIVGQTPQYADK